MNVYMYVVSVDVPLWHLVFYNVCNLRGSGTSGGIGGMVGIGSVCGWSTG